MSSLPFLLERGKREGVPVAADGGGDGHGRTRRLDRLRVADHGGSGNGAGGQGEVSGSQLTTYYVGQAVGLMNHVQPARRVVYQFMEEFIEASERLAGLVENAR